MTRLFPCWFMLLFALTLVPCGGCSSSSAESEEATKQTEMMSDFMKQREGKSKR